MKKSKIQKRLQSIEKTMKKIEALYKQKENTWENDTLTYEQKLLKSNKIEHDIEQELRKRKLIEA